MEASSMTDLKFGLPNLVGAIDCTHVKMLAPPSILHSEESINWKIDYTGNLWQLGLTVGRTVTSSERSSCATNSHVGELRRILIVNNGYGLQLFLILPFLYPGNRVEENYSLIHKKAMCVIERSFGQIKKRFFRLDSTMHIKLDRTSSVITACVHLHKRLFPMSWTLTALSLMFIIMTIILLTTFLLIPSQFLPSSKEELHSSNERSEIQEIVKFL